MKYIFFGTPQYAADTLSRLIATGMKPALVVTAPDAPAGRNKKLTAPAVKVVAEKHDIPLLQPERANDKTFLDGIRKLSPDVGVLVAYGKILSQELITLFPKGIVNIHPSLLPCWRGPSPLQYAILHGDEVTGVTLMLVDNEVDHGPILASRRFDKLRENKLTAEELGKKLFETGSELLIEMLPRYLANDIKPVPQSHAKATYSKMIKKEDGHIDWKKSATEIERMTRAYRPWPGAYAFWESKKGRKKITIRETNVTKRTDEKGPGLVFAAGKKIAVQCGEGALLLEVLQIEGKQPVSGVEFHRGYTDFIGSRLA